MHWPTYVKKEFYICCSEQKNCPTELIKALKHSPRTKKFLENLSREISKAERLVHKRRGTPLKLSTIRLCIHDMTKVLIRGIELEANAKLQSDSERYRLQVERDYYADLRATVDGKPQGVFEELDIVTTETEESKQTRASERGKTS